ncbi:MAG TPA: MBL fold metallo-hydrolase [Ignavibacteriaceae bacterium]
MILHILGSGSKGNGYILRASNREALILECGMPLIEVMKVLEFDLSGLHGALVTHSHLDHSGKAEQYCKSGINVYTQKETIDSLKFESHRLKPLEASKSFELGSFKILPFKLVHDVPTVGFLIFHHEIGKMVFITDTKYLTWKFEGLNHLLIECNYSTDLMNERLIQGSLKGFLYNRVQESHLSLETLKIFLQSNDLSKVKNIVLLHLSDGNSHERKFIQDVSELTGKKTFAASQGKKINLSLNPF